MSQEDVLIKEQEEKKEEQIVQSMEREAEPKNKCCKIMKEDVHVAGKCCAYTWCCTLNGIECCCVGMSRCFIGLSDIALACNKCLEQIDCDTH
jgi:hypothetical protein